MASAGLHHLLHLAWPWGQDNVGGSHLSRTKGGCSLCPWILLCDLWQVAQLLCASAMVWGYYVFPSSQGGWED